MDVALSYKMVLECLSCSRTLTVTCLPHDSELRGTSASCCWTKPTVLQISVLVGYIVLLLWKARSRPPTSLSLFQLQTSDEVAVAISCCDQVLYSPTSFMEHDMARYPQWVTKTERKSEEQRTREVKFKSGRTPGSLQAFSSGAHHKSIYFIKRIGPIGFIRRAGIAIF